MKHKLLLIAAFYIKAFTGWLPDAPFVMRFRGWLYSFLMNKAGRNFQVAANVSLKGIEYLSVGDNVYIGPNCQLILRVGCIIGDGVLVGPNCVIADGNHGFDGVSYRYAQGKRGVVEVGSGSWIAANCVLTQSCRVGERTVVGACSVVVGGLHSDSIYTSAKAERIAIRKSE